MTVPDDSRARVYRLFFALAAAYNVAFAAWAIVRPRAFFDLFSMDASRYPAIWQCLGMGVSMTPLVAARRAARDSGIPPDPRPLAPTIRAPCGCRSSRRASERSPADRP